MNTATNHTTIDEIDLGSLYESHSTRIRAFIARLIDDREAAEDLCHDTFLKAVRSWGSRRLGGSATAWLYQIARNTAYDYLRRRLGIVIMDLQAADTEAGVNQLACLYPDLPLQLARLPTRTRQALLLFSAGYRTQEIAANAGTSDMVIKHLISRGRRRLRAWSREQ